MALAGWLFDAYPVEAGMVVWLVGEGGRPHRLTVPFAPIFYAAGPRRALERIEPALAAARIPVETAMVIRQELFSGTELPVLQIAVQRPVMFPTAVRLTGRVPGVSLFTCDLSVPQLFFAQTGLFPLGRYRIEERTAAAAGSRAAGARADAQAAPVVQIQDLQAMGAPTDLEYALPPLSVMRLRLDGDPVNPTHTRRTELEASVDGETVVLCGDRPGDLIGSLNRLLARYDPDVILTEWGDSYLLPRLQALAQRAGMPLRWNREAHQGIRSRRARSYVTYGQTVYTAGAHMLFGRWHLDLRNSFIYAESEMAGLLEIARLARLPVQYAARTSIGTAISAMQLHHAIQRGILIPWHKSEPEAFKSAGELLVTDKGGLTYQPIVGFFEGVGELDFSSMYPTIMARFNVSPETVNCACCPDAPRVPETGARLCQRRKGLVPEVLEPLLERRAYYKRRKWETAGAERALYQQRQTALKWCLVCCLDGGTTVLYKDNGVWRIAPIRDVVETYLPGDAHGWKPAEGLEVAGVDPYLRPCAGRVKAVIKTPAPAAMIRTRLRWGRALLMTPNHRCYVLCNGRLEVKRADQLEIGDWIPLISSIENLSMPAAARIDLVQALKGVLSPEEASRLSVGRGKLAGGIIQRLRALVDIDEDLGFLLGFYVGDGSAARNMIRFDVGADEQEHLKRLRCILQRRFGLRSRHYRERRARMYVLQELIAQVVAKALRANRKPPDRVPSILRLIGPSLVFAPVTSVEIVPYNAPYVYCFELAEDPAAFLVEGGILTGNSFGYLGYRNARFGRIEAHEATTAFSREMLLRTKELAESRGYRMLHALVDSMWLHRPGATMADYETLARAVERETGLPIFVEGFYDWIAFLPSRTHPGLGVPNRYLGRFDDGTTKVRGIEVRRSDLPALVERAQARMLEVLFGARTLSEVRAAIPRVLDILTEAVLGLRGGEVRAADLAITTTISRTPDDYRSNAAVAVAARQMARAGVRLHPGERIQYIITDAGARLPDDRVRPLGLLGADWSYDVDYYTSLLLRATETILGPLGYPAARLEQEVSARTDPPG